MKTKRLITALILGFIITVAVSSFSGFASDCGQLSDKILRIHILANSDSEEDQTLKLAVRDAIIAETQDVFARYTDKTELLAAAETLLPDIKQTAARVIAENGYDYTVNAEITNMYFTVREYDGFNLPSGYYDAVRVTIGEAKGKNWWCVLFPQLCIPAALDKKDVLSSVLTEKEIRMITEKTEYEFRFKLLEWLQELTQKLV